MFSKDNRRMSSLLVHASGLKDRVTEAVARAASEAAESYIYALAYYTLSAQHHLSYYVVIVE